MILFLAAIINSVMNSIILLSTIPKILYGDNTESRCRFLKNMSFFRFILLSSIPFSGVLILIIVLILMIYYRNAQ